MSRSHPRRSMASPGRPDRGEASARWGRGLGAVGILFLASGLATPAARAVDLVRPEEALLAIFSLETQIQTEEALLARIDGQYRANVDERERYRTRLDRLAAELETAWQAPRETFDSDAAARADDELERLEKAMELAWDEGRRLRREALEGRARVALLRGRLERLTRSLPADTETLTGYWDVQLLSGGERGVFFLVQSGAVVSGEYGLEGGFQGSLQGTFVDGQVALHRIDTRLGRVMDLDGAVSADGRTIRGTWRRYDLSSGRPATGAWTASRRQREEPGAAEERAP